MPATVCLLHPKAGSWPSPALVHHANKLESHGCTHRPCRTAWVEDLGKGQGDVFCCRLCPWFSSGGVLCSHSLSLQGHSSPGLCHAAQTLLSHTWPEFRSPPEKKTVPFWGPGDSQGPRLAGSSSLCQPRDIHVHTAGPYNVSTCKVNICCHPAAAR